MSGRRARAVRRTTDPRPIDADRRWGVVRLEGGLVLGKRLTRPQAEQLLRETTHGPISGTWVIRDLHDTELVELDLKMEDR